MKALMAVTLTLSSIVATAQDKIEKNSAQTLRYVAIGDSYSIGEGASPDESWPAVLTRHLNENGLRVDLVANPSRTGWTTQQAIDHELPVFAQSRPDVATLQIGVNDWVQGIDEETFRERLALLLDRMLEFLSRKDRLLVVTIPDFSAAPSGSDYARGRNISEGLARFNKVLAEEAARRSLRVVDVFELSKKMQGDSSLVAGDGLHPSAKEYAEWEKIILPAALELFAKNIPKSL